MRPKKFSTLNEHGMRRMVVGSSYNLPPSSDGTTFNPQRKEYQMFTRVVEVTSKAGKARELTRTVNERVLPILKNQPGFLDEITLVSDEDPNRLLAISFWKSKEHAETYQREQYNKVTEIISNFLEGTPQVRTFEVEQSTVHKIASGRAA